MELVKSADASAGRPASLKSIADAGLPHWHVVIDCGCVVALLGACCAFIIVAADNLAHFGLFEQRWPLVCISVAIVSPLAFLRTMDSLRFTSLLSLVATAYITVLSALYAVSDDPDAAFAPCPPDDSSESCPPGETATYKWGFGVLASLPGLALAFGAQSSAPFIYNELERPTQLRFAKVFFAGNFSSVAVYLVVALCGYYSFGDKVKDNLLESYPHRLEVQIGRLGLALVVLFSYPLLALPFRKSVASLVYICGISPPKESTSFFESNPIEVLPTVLLLGFNLYVGLANVSLGLVIDFAGALGATIVVLFGPSTCYLLVFRKNGCDVDYIIAAFIAAFGVFICITFMYLFFGPAPGGDAEAGSGDEGLSRSFSLEHEVSYFVLSPSRWFH